MDISNKTIIMICLIIMIVSGMFFIPFERYGVVQSNFGPVSFANGYYNKEYYNIYNLPENGQIIFVKPKGQLDFVNVELKYKLFFKEFCIRFIAIIIFFILNYFLLKLLFKNATNTSKRNPLIKKSENILIDAANFDNELINNVNLFEEKLHVREKQLEEKEKELQIKYEDFYKLLKDKENSIPWIVDLYSKYCVEKDEYIAWQLTKKSNPAFKAAQEVKRINTEKRNLIKEKTMLEYTVKYYESLYPILEESKENEVSANIPLVDNKNSNYDYAKDYLSTEEYDKLSNIEKYQLALDRYTLKNKSKQQIGKIYEQYIGYTYEKQGYEVYYQGIIKGYEDLGRDLICIKNGITHIVQCKNWSKKKVIRENSINQLYGTTVKYWIEQNKNDSMQMYILDENVYCSEFTRDYKIGNIKAVLYTSTILSDTATEFAQALGIEVHENFELGKYPMIKCNINRITKEKIYHLPFDQQYDKTKINSSGEKYVFTVKEAENLEFRRAKKWIESS